MLLVRLPQPAGGLLLPRLNGNPPIPVCLLVTVQVHLGTWRHTQVAIKVLNGAPDVPTGRSSGSSAQSTGSLEARLQRVRMAPYLSTDALPSYSQQLLSGCTLSKPHAWHAMHYAPPQEVALIASLRHPNVLSLLAACASPCCLVSEYCSRGSLSDVLRVSAETGALLTWQRRLEMVRCATHWAAHSPWPVNSGRRVL